MPKSVEEIQDRIVREFELLSDWTERYKYIIKLGDKLDPLDEQYKVEDNLVRGCQSQVWLTADLNDDGTVEFTADSDAAIVKGLVALMVRLYSGQAPDTILNTEPEFIKRIGMEKYLSPTRSNGLVAMVKQMKIYAMAYKSKQEQAEA
jgi:cysteine desulfuration protein SufE